MQNEVIKLFEGKKIMILGLGREGLSTYHFIRKFLPNIKLTFADKKNLKELGGEFLDIKNMGSSVFFNDGDRYLDDLQKFDLVIKTPGIPNKLEEIKKAKENGVEFLSQTEIFLKFFKDKTIGITGTKGKSTTSSLIYHILNSSGKKVELLGNIGKPVLDYFESGKELDYFIFEMSSHQLSDVSVSPHIGVFLNIFPEHLDYYEDFEDYFNSKANITKYQNDEDLFIYNSEFEKILKLAKTTKAKIFDFTNEDISMVKSQLGGNHNQYNIKAAISVALNLGLNKKDILEAVESFKPLEGRLEVVGNVNGVDYVNDTLSTIPEAAIAAVESYKDKNITLILGGFDRGVDYDSLGKYLAGSKNVRSVILIGQTGTRISEALDNNGFSGNKLVLGVASMLEIVKKASEVTEASGVVLMSPASTSFDMFKDYKDRGDQFKKAVECLVK